MGEEPEDSYPVSDHHQHHVVGDERLAVIKRIRAARSRNISPAMQPEHHGFGRLWRPLRRPHIQIQTIFQADDGKLFIPAKRSLRTRRPRLHCIAHTTPGLHRLRFALAQLAHRRLRKRPRNTAPPPLGSSLPRIEPPDTDTVGPDSATPPNISAVETSAR